MVRNLMTYKEKIKNKLYLVPTPIGNLEDITLRAIETLKNSDFILCEDTRVSKKLIERYDIKSKLIINHKFNEKKNVSKIIRLIKGGSSVSIISDAGTPNISDPGKLLINECIDNNIDVIPLPGPSSVATAVSVSGFSEKFFFYGFFPEKKKIIENDLKMLSDLNSSIVFFVSPKKFLKIIPYLKKNFSNRNMLICREMSKFYEEYIRTSIKELDKLSFEIKGEFTIVISEEKFVKNNSQNLNESDKIMIRKMINNFSIKEIINLMKKNNISKKEIYNFCIKIKNEN
ncbi:16S rRNA (cytidine(1402)-2'-O)-methyltransferase [Candidatus Pelagibacter sp.]|nr:16S rRNA (cytidine(1402)-2'-O)-methyltransferase [Candidatus Pelagibacter sp.]